ncbi:hypothetical protein SAMN05192533_10121 [Mesobacillus persicus]|uniref:ASCH domain-containing protein n=1 Tax=Mesobacillus persicus TaxID=930146 RepID=A0A1H7VN67_9BACI|nr:hypothetical protein [Mesobacillus persicus]SEM10329.1 hypothetical protein SAMN05192533_10121 [Mesobacillus persicus]
MDNQKTLNELSPKTGPIERLVVRPQDIENVINGTRTVVRRNGRYADVGEIFTLSNKKFVINRVYSMTLGSLTDEDVLQDGFSTVEDYKKAVLSSHHGMTWNPETVVWVHEFSPITQ